MEARQHEIEPAAETTCEWLSQHDTFQRWIDQKRGLLWIKGNPGTGKSTIMKYALQNVCPDKPAIQSKLVILSFFFHGRGSKLQHTPLGFYRSILHQILDQVPSALSGLVNDFRKNCDVKGKPGEKWDWHETELRTFLESSIPKILEYYSIRLFADALDESGQAAAVKLAEEFRNLISRCSTAYTSAFSICFSCRRYPIIEFKGEEICIDQENSKDIRTYIQNRLRNEKHQIRETITLRASNSFQWARLVVDRVEQMRRNGEKEKMIKEEILRIPPNLNDFYRELLESIREEEIPEALKLIQWILFAMRPLSLDELRFATAIDPNLPYTSLRQCEDEGILAENNNEMEKRVKSLSRGLADIHLRNNIPVVQFIHQSVNDFLFDDGLQILFGESWESLDLALGLANHNLSRSCIRYIDMEEIVRQKSIDWKKAAKSELPFLSYATTSWMPHAERAYAKGIPQGDLMNFFHWPLEDLLKQWVNIYNTLDEYSKNCPYRKTTILHMASRYGIVDLLLAALGNLNEIDVKADSKDNYGRTPLSWAAANGHEANVQLLLNTSKVEADSKDNSGRTPLSWAALNGHEAVVQLLLNTSKVKADSKDNSGRTALSCAAVNGHEAVVQLLLNISKVEADSKDNYGRTPLSWAALNGRKAVVQLLLNTSKVEADSKDNSGRTALSRAAANGHEAIVQLLLNISKVEADSKDNSGRTALSWAAANGHEAIVQLLLNTSKVKADSKDYSGRTPLSWAAANGHEAVVQLLLNTSKVEADSKDNSGQTPLSWAAANGRKAVVKLLLDNGANINIEDRSGWTALQLAALNRYEEVEQLFVIYGAHEPEDFYGLQRLFL
jgi:ankyrin repeat protein